MDMGQNNVPGFGTFKRMRMNAPFAPTIMMCLEAPSHGPRSAIGWPFSALVRVNASGRSSPALS
jgi:hypothetical protein